MSTSERAVLRRVLKEQGIASQAVLDAIGTVPRELFVPEDLKGEAYVNAPLPIGEGQTVSQPYTVAYMVELAGVAPGTRVLEVGAGSGYAAAIIAEVVGDAALVTAVEVLPSLVNRARKNLSAAGYPEVRVVEGDGRRGYAAGAPYDAIVVSAEARHVPPALVEQLADEGSLVIPVRESGFAAVMQRVEKRGERTEMSTHGAFSFVPLTGSDDS